MIFYNKGAAMGHEMDDVAVALGVGILNHSVESKGEGFRFRSWMRTPGRSCGHDVSWIWLVGIIIVAEVAVVDVNGEIVLDRRSGCMIMIIMADNVSVLSVAIHVDSAAVFGF